MKGVPLLTAPDVIHLVSHRAGLPALAGNVRQSAAHHSATDAVQKSPVKIKNDCVFLEMTARFPKKDRAFLVNDRAVFGK